jgi:twinkle protein
MFHKDFTNPEKVIFYGEDGEMKDIYGNPIIYPEGFFDQETLEKAVDAVGDKVIYYNNYGACSWDVVKGAIRHAVLVEGVTDIVLDPISRMVQGLTASEANTALEKFADELSKMAKDLGFIYYCFCHLKAPESGPPHERGGKVLSYQFTGSRAMMRSTYYMWGIERNKDPDLSEKERNTSTIVLLEDRKYGRSGYFKVYYNPLTGDYLEPPAGFLDSSCERIEEYVPVRDDISF